MLHVFPWRNGEPMWTMETYGNPWKHPGSRMVPRHSASEDNHRQLSNMNCSMPNAPGTVRWGSPMAALWIPGTLTKGWSQGTRCMHQFSCRVQLLPGRPGFFSTFFKYTRSQALKCMEKPENIAESSMTAGMHPREKQCIHIYIYQYKFQQSGQVAPKSCARRSLFTSPIRSSNCWPFLLCRSCIWCTGWFDLLETSQPNRLWKWSKQEIHRNPLSTTG